MSRSSPGVRRVVSILNFFADHPGQAFSLTDLVRALKLSRATCHGLLTGLTEAGYLFRTADKHYLLGPAIVAIGEVAKDHFSPLQVARPDMRQLADEMDVTCLAAFREHTSVIIRERCASRSQVGFSVSTGTRLPLLPQFAGTYFTSGQTAAIEEFVEEWAPPMTDEQRRLLDKSIECNARDGFIASSRNPLSDGTEPTTDWIMNRTTDTPLTLIEHIDPGETYELSWVGAPVMEAQETAFTMVLQGFTGQWKGAEIERIGKHLRATCDQVAKALHRPIGGAL